MAQVMDAHRLSPEGSFRWQRKAVLRSATDGSDDGSLTERVRKLCLDHGLRISRARCLILDALWKADGHPTAEEIFAMLRDVDPQSNLSSVYRNLRTFEKVGIIARLEWEGAPARYEDAARHRHGHLVDIDSGSIVEFRSDEIDALVVRQAEALGYRPIGCRLTLFGRSSAKN